MYLIEKIGELILISLEGKIEDSEIDEIKSQLENIAKVANDNVVVSFNLSHLDNKVMIYKVQERVNELLRFCHLNGLRVYSYSFK